MAERTVQLFDGQVVDETDAERSASAEDAADPSKDPKTGTPIEYAAPAHAGQPNYEEAKKVSYAVVAGFHRRAESAQAEVHALRLLKIPAVMESYDGGYRVLISRYWSKEAAESEVERYRSKGHRFKVVADG